VVKANGGREKPTKVALRDRVTNDSTTKRRRPAVAGLHEPGFGTNGFGHIGFGNNGFGTNGFGNNADHWKQNQSKPFGTPRGSATSF
jgi:hypothetical protein